MGGYNSACTEASSTCRVRLVVRGDNGMARAIRGGVGPSFSTREQGSRSRKRDQVELYTEIWDMKPCELCRR